jgi:hypothetical protein
MYTDIVIYVQSIERYVSISGDDDSISRVVNQPEGWFTMTPGTSLLQPKGSRFSIVCTHISTFINLHIHKYVYINMQTIKKYVSISSDGDINSGIVINQRGD